MVDAGFEPGTSGPEVWRATNEPPHLLKILLALSFKRDSDPKQIIPDPEPGKNSRSNQIRIHNTA